MLNAGMFTSRSDEWETPEAFFRALDAEFHFDLDTCAAAENAKCAKYIDRARDGLRTPWEGVCWCNPPYGREIGKWVHKAENEAARGCTVVLLLPARTDTRWFHDCLYGKAELRFVRGRLKFGAAKNSAPFPSMIAILRGGKVNDDGNSENQGRLAGGCGRLPLDGAQGEPGERAEPGL